MDSNPYMNLNFVDLLQSQQNTSVGVESPSIPFLSTQANEGRKFEHKTPSERKERRSWSPTDDVVLISSWLNTSKDPLVGNEQRSVAFWKRVAAYFEASPKVGGCEKRKPSHCKQRWQKINDLVSKFAGAYEAATREKRSGQNENDVLKLAHEIFFTNHNRKFTLEHAWKELRNDQKWCALYTDKNDGSSKERKCDEGSQSASSVPSAIDDEGSNRPHGVRSAKARGKKPVGEGKDLSQFQTMWSIKMQDSVTKKRLSKMKLLDSLIAKQDPLQDYEEALKKKLITELMSD
ncbi:PREDICTED: glutathione S-transferase T3-like [Brassica oleracea var. oleracea]|uniref:Myb-like domain-containing protein n=1 Tax=Brassica oleracea var. oleracea TaxID=109376 RepID=A0A0D3DWM0_BRAOL|nr:PREDICTED: glutathione S-transferase T3-like [Brassica oleracea var. oleracea]